MDVAEGNFDAEGVKIQAPLSEVAMRYTALYRQLEVDTALLL